MTREPAKGGIKRKTIFSIVLLVVLASVCAYTFYDLNGGSFDLKDRQALLIVSDSMDGDNTGFEINSFPKDTFIMVKHLSEQEKREVKVGDVLSFQYLGILDHHRVIETNFDNGFVITHGDNVMPGTNETVKLSDINGIVVGTNHSLGVVVTLVKNNFLLFIAIIATLAIIGEIYRAYRDGVFSKEEA